MDQRTLDAFELLEREVPAGRTGTRRFLSAISRNWDRRALREASTPDILAIPSLACCTGFPEQVRSRGRCS
jgi:hypothetical protein